MKIGVFDSGLGGLTVLQALLKIQPNTEYIYLADTINLPYGDKSEQELQKFAQAKIAWMQKQEIDLLIVACNTSDAALGLDKNLDEYFPQGAIRIIKPLANQLILQYPDLQKIAVMSTNFTAQKNLFGQFLMQKQPKIIVTPLACPQLVSAIENFASKKEIFVLLEEYLQPLFVSPYQGLVLGCSHYPLITKEITQFLREKNLSEVLIWNPAEAMAKQLKAKHLEAGAAKISCYITDLKAKKRLEYYLKLLLGTIVPIHHIEPLC